MSGVGINLAGVSYWGSEYPFLDRMKSAGWWTAVDASYSAIATPVGVDANGYPTTVPKGTSYIYAQVPLDPVELSMPDRYVLTYQGTATFTLSNAKIISSEPGKIVFEATAARTQMALSNLNSANPITQISVVREDQVALFKSGEIFNPAFIDKIDPFSTLRFMDWGATNNSTLSSWADRPTLTDRSWSYTEGGVPIEVQVALANKTHNNMWINIPAMADDEYVRKALRYIRDNLDPTLKVKVEYSNEVWNWGFQQAQYALTKGDQLFGKDVNGDGVIDRNNTAEHVGDGWLQYYGYRAAQIAAIANTTFGTQADARLENVLASYTVGQTDSILAGVKKANLGTVAKLFDDYAIPTYYGNLGQGTATDLATLLSWARNGAAGVTAAFQEILHGGTLSATVSVDALAAKMSTHGDLAALLGLNFVAYEGGIDLTAYRVTSTADQAVLVDFYNRILADPRTAALYQQVETAFTKAGGVEFNAFNDVGVVDKNGAWGALASIYDSGSVRYDTLLQLAKDAATANAAAAAAAASAPPLAINPVLTVTASDPNLTYNGDGYATLTGDALSNRLIVRDGGGKLFGMDGADRLYGGAGADYLDGGTGADTMVGGAGNDVYIVDNTGDVITEAAGEGIDEVRTTLASYRLGANLENLTYGGSAAFTGIGNDLDNVIRGGPGKNTLNGAAGNDTLYGGDSDDTFYDSSGADRMIGGKGNDFYTVDNAGDVVIEAAGEGTDSVMTSVSYSVAGQSIESLGVNGTAAVDLIGNDFGIKIGGNDNRNTITGGAGKDTLSGVGGDDTLNGLGGDDYIDGGTGNDTLFGGDGNDTLKGSDGDDVLVGGAGVDLLYGGAGNDTFRFLSVNDLGKTRETSDAIGDFGTGDKIDLSAIDAIKSTATVNDAFTFIGAANFSKKAGELRVANYLGKWEIMGDIDGDGVADFTMLANKPTTFVKTDFIL